VGLVIGDVCIDFLLNEDGSLKATIFNKQNDIQFIGNIDGYTQGVGIPLHRNQVHTTRKAYAKWIYRTL